LSAELTKTHYFRLFFFGFFAHWEVDEKKEKPQNNFRIFNSNPKILSRFPARIFLLLGFPSLFNLNFQVLCFFGINFRQVLLRKDLKETIRFAPFTFKFITRRNVKMEA